MQNKPNTTQSLLNLRQRRFLKAYLLTGNGTQAAIEAGYSPDSARFTASRLLTNDNIWDELLAAQNHIQRQSDITVEEHLTKLADLRDRAKEDGHMSAAVRAEELRGRVLGFYIHDKNRNKARPKATAHMSEAELIHYAMQVYDELRTSFPKALEPIHDKIVERYRMHGGRGADNDNGE